VDVYRAVALAGEAVAEPEKALLARADEDGEFLDLGDAEAGDRRRPFRRAGGKMGFQLRRRIGEAGKIVAVGMAVAEEHMHDGAGERTVCAGA
jgi:hypothetical protein